MQNETAPRGAMMRVLDVVERIGNRLPDPVTLFVILILLVLIASWLALLGGASATHPGTGDTITAVNLFSGEMVRQILTGMVQTFAAFPPLGLVLVVMIGIGVAERSGMIEAALSGFVRSMPPALITAAVVFAGMMSSLSTRATWC
jgi:aminobenzoyl-glutamate transport protein